MWQGFWFKNFLQLMNNLNIVWDSLLKREYGKEKWAYSLHWHTGCKFTQITLKNRLHASLQEEEVQIQKHWWLNFCYSFRAKKVSFLKFSPFLEKQLPLHILLAHLEQLQHHDFFRERNLNPFFSSEKRLMVNFLVRIIL